MAYPSVTYTFTNGTTADGANVSTNFTNLVSGFSDGTKDFNMNAGTLAGNFTCNGNVVLGNATSDTIALTGIITINTSGSYLANQLGTALLPTYTFSGDLNTGIWSSGADNLSVSTAGVQRINVDANGDIQIGAITAPVNSSAGRKYVTIEALTTAPAVIQFGNATGGAGVAMGQLEFYNRDNSGSSSFRSAYMQVGVEGSTANNRGSYFVFGVKADGVSGSGSTAFKINNASQAEASLGAVTTPGYSFSGDLNTGMWSSGADTLNFSTGGVQAMKISSAQYVGFSQTTPAFRVDVLSTAAAGDALRLGQDGDGPTVLRIDNNASEAGNRNWVFRNRFSAVGQLEIGVSTAKGGATFTNVMTLDSSGDIKIGGVPAGYGRLTVYSAYQTIAAAVSSFGGIYITTTDSMAADKGGTLSFGGSYTGTTETRFAGIAGLKENGTDNNYAGYLAFYTRPAGAAPVERMKISSTGGLIVNGGNVYDNDISFNDTAASKSHALYTLSTGTPGMYFDHRATSNTGTFSWRVGTGGATTLMTLLSTGNLHINTTTERSCKFVVSNSDTATNTQFGQSSNTGVCLINTSATNGNFTYICNKDSNGTLNSQICFVNADHTSQGYIDMVCRNGGSFYLTRINSVGQIYSVATYNTAVGATNRAMYVDNVGLIGNLTSTREAKANIQDLESVEWLKNLKPRQFNYRFKNDDGSYSDNLCKDLEYGLIAEEVEETNKLLVFYDEKNNNGKLQGVHYNKLIVPMLKMIQELSAEVAALKSKLP